MMISPAFMFGVSGNLDVTYDDFDELKEHPLAAAAMVNFTDLFESMYGKSKEDVVAMLSKKDELQEKMKNELQKDDSRPEINIGLDLFCETITILENLSN